MRTGSSLIGSTARADADRLVQAGEGARRRRAPSASSLRPLQAPCEVAIAEVEPHLDAQPAQRVHHREGVVAQTPAALVDHTGQPEGDQVGVGRDVRAVDLDVIARVGDHRQPLRAERVGDAPRELRAAGPAGQQDDVAIGAAHSHRLSGSPLRRMPAWIL